MSTTAKRGIFLSPEEVRKQKFKHLKAIFIHFMQYCGPWIHTKNNIPIHLGQVLKCHKIHVSNIFYHFLSVVSFGNRAKKISEKGRVTVLYYKWPTFTVKNRL